MSDAALLDSCRDMVATRLSEDLAEVLAQIATALNELLGKTSSQEMYILYADSADLARGKNAAITAGFKKSFFTRFNEEKRRGNAEPGIRNLDLSNLSLLEPDDLEVSLAANTIANSIGNICGEELFGLGKRIGVLLNQPDLKTEQIPLGPDVIGFALLDALKDQDASIKIKLLLVTRINKLFPAKVRAVYQEVNRYLVEQNVLPTIRVGAPRAVPSPTSTLTSTPAPQPPSAPAAQAQEMSAFAAPEANPQDMFAMLQQLIALGRGGGGGGGGAPFISGLPEVRAGAAMNEVGAMLGQGGERVVNPMPPSAMANPVAINSAVMQALTQLQHGHWEGLGAPSLNHEQFASGHVNVLRELKNSPAAGMMGQMETMTLDIVALVFDYILDDSRIPDSMKALIGRLQIPVLKVTMMDKSFFSQKAHPARRLLDLLADASLGWDPAEGHGSSLYQKVDQIVQRILNQFDDGLEVFSDVLTEFEGYLAEEKQSRDELTLRSAQYLRNREQFDVARVVAHDTVMASLLDRPTPPAIRDFLLKHWESWLARICVDKGESSQDWADAVVTMDDLLWSLTPKTDKDERRKLIELLPRLLKRLDSSINTLGLGQAVRDAFFSDLVKCHAVAVKAGFHGDSEIAEETGLPKSELPVAEAGAYGPRDFEAIPLISAAIIPDAALLQEIAAAQEEASDVEEITISGVRGEAWDEPRDSHFESMVKQLKRGVWIEFKQDDGVDLRAKLAWISPLQGTYLFTNRLGQRAVSINAQGLAVKFREGHAHVIENVPLIDRAVNNVFQHFQKGG